LEGTATARWIGVRDLFTVNGHSPHKGLVSAGFDECGTELGEEGKGMVFEGNLTNTTRAPLGPCARCGGIELNTVVRAGARMCLVCSYSAEVIDMEEENQ
jgi:hypothetical protein